METFLRAGLGNALLATILALGAAGAGYFLRRRPAVRHGLWLLVLLKLVTPPLWVVPLTVPGVSRLVNQEPTVSELKVETSLNTIPAEWLEAQYAAEPLEEGAAITVDPPTWLGSMDWTRWAAMTWLAGSVATLAVTGLRIRRWNRLLRLVEPTSDDVQDQVERLAKQMGLVQPPTSWWFPGPSAPMLWALGCQAKLIVPSELWGRLDERQRITLLVHELAHLRRKDHWVRVVELLATAFYWWLPLAWIARWALREAEEQCCDAWVVWTCPDALRAYAETLLDTVDFLSETGRAAPLAASGFGHAHHLKRRVTMIMQGKTPRGLGWTGMLTMFGLSALLLPLSPTWAQKADDEERAEPEVARLVQDTEDESEDSELIVLKRKLASELGELIRLKSAEKEDTTKPNEKGTKEEQGERSSKAKTRDAKTILELRDAKPNERKSPGNRPEAREIRFHFTENHQANLERELSRAKAEVERARAQLHRAESQLAKLGTEFKVKLAKSNDSGRESQGTSDNKNENQIKVNTELRLAPKRELFIVRDKEQLKKSEEEGRRLFENKLASLSSEKDRRIADLEKKLDELINEVKNLKTERGDSRK
ncbi:M56 family metallopeptidase [Singulisphaera acidiphila]|uniref:Antirepressor regulating drug resistance protein n=1 Tax=Singulisphaera acidiphila (strain ATCC BAA-1392 / DSM 18658 / VKM B-2454 / MOB10) TaxID=886293 RepID=L0D950_SINAD|nr:M56 family metallopeptidase [Singulisphaera acidiphila]AGA25777.1 antirepressor regulating drug resistance protein [Singulisphaera acidiphila DSM 18658]